MSVVQGRVYNFFVKKKLTINRRTGYHAGFNEPREDSIERGGGLGEVNKQSKFLCSPHLMALHLLNN